LSTVLLFRIRLSNQYDRNKVIPAHMRDQCGQIVSSHQAQEME